MVKRRTQTEEHSQTVFEYLVKHRRGPLNPINAQTLRVNTDISERWIKRVATTNPRLGFSDGPGGFTLWVEGS